MSLNDSILYTPPAETIDGVTSYVSYKPTGATSFAPADTINIKYSSGTDFMDISKSYVKFQIATVTGALTPQGVSAVIKDVQDQISGHSLPLARNWNIQNAVKLFSKSSEGKNIATFCEEFNTNKAAATFTVVMPLPTSFDIKDKLMPLSVLNSGWSQTYTLAANLDVVVSGSYSIQNFEVIGAMVTPSPAYLQQLSAGLAAGQSLKIPIVQYKSTTAALTATAVQTVHVSAGYVGSLNQIVIVEKINGSPHTNGTDLLSWFINKDGRRYPQNKIITSGVESVYQRLIDNRAPGIEAPPTTQSFELYSFKSNADFSAGVETANGTINLDLDFTGNTPAATSVLEVFLYHDALMVISQNSVNLLTDV